MDGDPAQLDQDESDETLGKALASASPEAFEKFIRALEALPPVTENPGSKETGVR